MAARADIWLRYKDKKRGKVDSYYFKGTRLKTQDANEARTRARLFKAGKWPPVADKAAAVSVESFALPSEQVGSPMSGGPSGGNKASLPTESVAADSEEHQPTGPVPSQGAADWTNVAAAAAADAGAEPLKPEVVNPAAEKEEREATNDELAAIIVHFQLIGTEGLIKSKVYDKFVAPTVDAQERAGLAAPYKKMLDYGGTKLKLPAWVTGLVVPGVTALMCAGMMSRAWADLARAQKAAAPAPQQQAAA